MYIKNYDKDNIFAKILRSELPSNKVYENEYVLAFHDINPIASIHILIIPKGEYQNYVEFLSKASEQEQLEFFKAINHVTKIMNIQDNGFKLIANNGENAGQIVPHFHMHILSNKNLSKNKSTDL